MATSCQSCDTFGLIPTAPPYAGPPPAPPAQGCSAVWGQITGDIENQADIAALFNGYAELDATDNKFLYNITVSEVNVGAFGPYSDEFGYGYNTVFGFQAGISPSVTGIANTAIGAQTLPALTSGSSNTAVGRTAGLYITSGGSNVAVGSAALLNVTTGSNNVAVGNLAGPTDSAQAGTTCVGYQAVATKANQAVFGGPATTESLWYGNIALASKTITPIGTTGGQTINKTSGSVVFPAGESELIVNNSFAIAPVSGVVGSIIIATMRTADATAVLGNVVCTANGSFKINMKVATTAATRVDFVLFN